MLLMDVGVEDDHASPPRVRRYLVTVVAVGLGLTVLLAGLNIVIDPRSEFPSDVFTALVPDVPAEKIELLEALEDDPRTFVFGSSRSEAIPTQAITEETGKPAFNLSIHGGHAPDYALLYDYLRASDHEVDEVIVGVDDVSLAQPRNPEIAGFWRSSALTGLDPGPVRLVRRGLSSISVDYLLDSWRVVVNTLTDGYREAFSFDRHGVVHYPSFDRLVEEGRYPTKRRVQQTVRLWMSRYPPGHRGFRPTTLRVLDELAGRMQDDGVRMKVFLTPFHPMLVERLSANPRFTDMQREIDRRITEICRAGVELYDFRSNEWTEMQHWRDGVHFYHEVGEDIVRTMYAGDGNLCAPSVEGGRA